MFFKSLRKGKAPSTEDDEEPPSYTEQDKESYPGPSGDQPPDYEPPVHHNATGTSTRLQPATRKFPPVLNGYFKWTSTTCHLGPSADEKLFAVKMNWAWFSKEPPITLHDGPSESHPILGQASGLKPTKTMDCTVTIPSGMTPMNPDAPIATGAALKYTSWKDAQYVFSILVPPIPGSKDPGQMETFEWRPTHGAEARDLGGGRWSTGYKLVHMTGSPSEGGKRKEREMGTASDGREIVAIIINGSAFSMSKGVQFAFLGTGLTGVFGEAWEVTAVVSGLQLWLFSMIAASNA